MDRQHCGSIPHRAAIWNAGVALVTAPNRRRCKYPPRVRLNHTFRNVRQCRGRVPSNLVGVNTLRGLGGSSSRQCPSQIDKQPDQRGLGLEGPSMPLPD
jgi:hypothetical protein